MRILIVDDEPNLLEVLRDFLGRDGHAVATSNGGQDGIDDFRRAESGEDPFGLVITDLGMPEVNGHRVVAAIKTISPSTPIILLAGWGFAPVAGEEGVGKEDLILRKPPRFAELRRAVSRFGAMPRDSFNPPLEQTNILHVRAANLRKAEALIVGRYRIMRRTICLILEDDRYVAHTIPVDTVVAVKSEAEFRTLNVTWDGKAVLMFALDLASRAEKIS